MLFFINNLGGLIFESKGGKNHMESELIVAIGALLLSALGLLLSFCISHRAWRMSVTQHQLASFNAHQTYKQRLSEWAGEVLNTLSDSLILCELDPEKCCDFFQERNRLRSRYFSQIDSGRFFFENDGKDEYGQWKQGAFRGIAPEAIFTLKQALECIEKLNYLKKNGNAKHRHQLVELKRDFVSTVQDVVKPNNVQDELNSIKGS